MNICAPYCKLNIVKNAQQSISRKKNFVLVHLKN